MNRHFHDARYYLQRAGEHLALGVRETAAPVTERIRGYVGEDDEPAQTRWEAYRAELHEGSTRAVDELATTLDDARATVGEHREDRQNAS